MNETVCNILVKALSQYEEYYVNVVRELYFDEDTDDDVILNSKEFKNTLNNDLSNMCFTDVEIAEIITHNMNENTVFKFLALFIYLTHDDETPVDVISIIDNKFGITISEDIARKIYCHLIIN